MAKSYHAFKEKLDEEHKWPADYMFKFIVPQDKEQEIYNIFPKENWTSRSTKSGTYVSYTTTVKMNSSDEVIDVYERAHAISGIIAL